MPNDQLAALLDRVPVLRGLPRTVTELPGGLTNQNLHVVTERGDYVVRRFRGDAELLGIDRDAEHLDTRAAAEAGVGAPVVDYHPELGLLVIEFIDGTTYDNTSFEDPRTLERAAQAGYLRTVMDRHFPLDEEYVAHDPAFHRIESALTVRRLDPAPCNNDLLAGNFVDDGDKVWLIDYEYAGNNDPTFELGNTATECELDDDRVEALTAAYFGRESTSLLARVRLQMLVSAYGWALWGLIQSHASDIDFDFASWGRERFEKAARGFTSDGFEQLLEDVTGGH